MFSKASLVPSFMPCEHWSPLCERYEHVSLLCNRWKQVGCPYFFVRLSTHHWIVGYKTRTWLSHHPLIWKVLLYKNHHLQFEFLLNVQECSMVVQFLKHLPWQDLNTYQYSFWVFHHIRISFFASISFAASSGFAMSSKKTFVRKTTFILLYFQHVLEWEWIWSVLTNSKKSGSFSSPGNCVFSVFSLKST